MYTVCKKNSAGLSDTFPLTKPELFESTREILKLSWTE
jgi:hypothetical protein